MHFPSVTGSNLEGTKFNLPGDLAGDLNLVITAFWRDQQMLVDTWMPLARRLHERYSLVTYELPVIENRNFMWRRFIDSGMRAGIPDRHTREHTITLYLDKERFLEQLGVADNTIQVFLIDRAGRVLWHREGPLDPDGEESLSLFLELLKPAA